LIEAMKLYESTSLTALSYLSALEGPGAWTAIRSGEQFWSEYWGERRRNLLNTVYSVLAICRANRHGLRPPPINPWSLDGDVEQTVHSFVDQITVENTASGPRARLAGEWVEPWATADDLPCGVVGLIGLALNEYAHLLLGIAPPGSNLEIRARRAHVVTQRLA